MCVCFFCLFVSSTAGCIPGAILLASHQPAKSSECVEIICFTERMAKCSSSFSFGAGLLDESLIRIEIPGRTENEESGAFFFLLDIR